MHWLHFLDDKASGALVGVITGWALGQGTTLVRDYRTSLRLKKGLLQELEDVYEELLGTKLGYGRSLQHYALNGIEPVTPQKLSNLFFKQYYKDVFSKLNREQRLSYQLIHQTIDSLNASREALEKFTRATVERTRGLSDDEKQAAVEVWGTKIKTQYVMTYDAIFYVDHHLRNQKHPKWGFGGKTHKEYLQFCEMVRKEIDAVIKAAAEKLTREDLEKVFDEKHFPPETTGK
jgi:hypothetical protein